MEKTQTSRQIEDMTSEELEDLKHYLTLGYKFEKDRKDWFICIKSSYKHKQDKDLKYIYTIECTVPYLRYHIWFREREIEKLGFEPYAYHTERYRIADKQKISEISQREIEINKKLND